MPVGERVELPPPPDDLPVVRSLEPPQPFRAAEEASALRPLRRPTAGVRVAFSSSDDLRVRLGLALFDGESRALLAWRELTPDDLGAGVELGGIPQGRHWLVLASDRDAASFSYVSRQAIEVGPEGAEARLEAEWHHVVVHFVWPGLDQPTPPIVRPVVSRVGDPDWRYRPRTRSSLVYDESIRVVLRGLGAGTYRLQLEGAEVFEEDRGALEFAVPETESIRLRLRPAGL